VARFLYDGWNVEQELSSGGASIATLLTGFNLDETFTRTTASGPNALLVDPLWSTVALADASGNVQTRYTFEPFGESATSGTGSDNSFLFTGREHDGNGLSFHRARYYYPAIQRFISEDPIGFLGGDANVNTYIGNRPIDDRDPTGLIPFLITPPLWCPPRKDCQRPPTWWQRLICPRPGEVPQLPLVPDLIPPVPLTYQVDGPLGNPTRPTTNRWLAGAAARLWSVF
jgi:RHS repeat-associated protein